MPQPRFLILLFIFSSLTLELFSQNFLNNDLNGAVGTNVAPTGWQIIPFTDPNCLATGVNQATPDILSMTGPQSGFGICGNPYSGTTFASGLYGGGANLWHEGIMQSVSGFSIGCQYTVHFHQAVVKQNLGGTSYMDPSGGWSVYIDNTLGGTTAPTSSVAPFNSTSFVWEARSISFVATSTTHNIKFLPADDDSNQSNTAGGTDALRMGIDSIYITVGAINATQNPVICSDSSFTLPGGTIVTTSGIYVDTIPSTSGCDSIITINLTVSPTPTVTISPDITISQGSSAVLTASGGGTYSWTPSTGLSSTTSGNTNASPQVTTVYCVTVTNSNGCTSSACVTVTVSDSSGLPCTVPKILSIPNAFSPNEDGENDEFCIQNPDSCIEEFSIHIYNRWGEEVFESIDPKLCWNGKHFNKYLNPAVFVYFVRAKYFGSTEAIEQKGNVSIIR